MKHPTHHIEHFFFWLGGQIGKRPVAIIVGVLAFSAVCSIGLVNFREVNNVRSEYSPRNAPSQQEYQVAKTFLKQVGPILAVSLLIIAHCRKGALDPAYVMSRARDEGNLLREEYRWLLYNLTKALQTDVRVEKDGRSFGFADICAPYCEINTAFLAFLRLFDANNPSTFTYPSIELFGTQAFIGNNSFDTAVMPFYLVASTENTDVLIAWQRCGKRTGITGDNMVSLEVRRMGVETLPLLGGSILSMIVFVVVFSFRSNTVQSKPWECFIGCLVPLLSIVVSLGLMCFAGMAFQSIVVAALFLVLSVGVDDIFILTRAWDRTDSRMSIPERTARGPVDHDLRLDERDVSFGFGAFSSDTPAIRTFCRLRGRPSRSRSASSLNSSSSSAVLALSGRREERGYQAVLCCLRADPAGSLRAGREVRERAQTVTRWPTRILLLVVMCGYFWVSWTGIQRIETNISIDKMALPHTPTFTASRSLSSGHFGNMQPISVFVLKPGDLRDPEQLARVKQLVFDFEHSLNAYGSNSTFFWLPQYEDFLRFYAGQRGLFRARERERVRGDEPECVSSFFFITNFHDVIKYHELVPVVQDWRRIASEKYADLDVHCYSDHSPRQVTGSVLATLLCTVAICLFFIPHVLSILAASFAILSCSFGIFGLLSHWGIALDPLSLASLDHGPHISYHYYKTPHGHPRKRIEHALGTIGWPMVQVGTSTIVALSPLLFKQSYLALVFLKTIVVVVLLGMFHGLVVLPVVLPMITRYQPTSSAESSERSSQRSTERKESFYKTQHLIKAMRKGEAGAGRRLAHEERDRVTPLSVAELEDTVGKGVQLVHKIPLGRSSSNAL
ncbi:Patched-related protein 9 [Aphelenchoides fujianensis]|nr:Patched-related protein 9 [Aphelenchoides fujianensis]